MHQLTITQRRATVILALIINASAVRAQTRPDSGGPLGRRAGWARRATSAPRIDGRLDDSVWQAAPVLTDFVQSRPRPGTLATLRTEARVLFDDEALYVAIRAFDPCPDSILAPYPRRDDEGTSDWLFVEIDTRHDHRTAISLGVNPRGVQVDGAFSNDGDYDVAWNGVWEAVPRMDSLGWTAEYRIPFSQLALTARRTGSAADSALIMGFNVYRYTPHRGEVSNWSPRLPTVLGVVSRFDELRGIAIPPRRIDLEVVPYLASRAGRSPALTGAYASARLPRGSNLLAGSDIKARITPDVNLVVAVHPDFGQVEVDPSEVNLTSYETFFPERRPFFVEGADLFSFNSNAGFGLPFHSREVDLNAESPFYSRRIGRSPRGTAPDGSYVLDAPAFTDLIAAAKLQGRFDNGASVGLLAASTRRELAHVQDPLAGRLGVVAEPATQFAVLRGKREYRRGASSVGWIMTFVDRTGADSTPSAIENQLARRALVVGGDARHRFDSDRYELTTWAAHSDVRGAPQAIGALVRSPDHYLQRPDAAHLARFANDSGAGSLQGTGAQLMLAKVAGEHWRWSVAGRDISPGFETNDAGFQRSADWLIAMGTLSYQQTSPQGAFRRWSIGSNQLGAGWSTAGEHRATVANLTASADLLRSDWGGVLGLDYDGSALATEALRGGPALLLPARIGWTAQLHTDTRRRTLMTVSANTFNERNPASHGRSVSADINSRVVDHLRVEVGAAVGNSDRAWQYVGSTSVSPAARQVVARLQQRTVSMTTRADLAFSSHLTLQLYAQPLIGAARYDDFGAVADPRATDASKRVRSLTALPPGMNDPSFGTRSLLGNTVLRWEYRRGSTLYLVWSQQRSGIDDGRTWNIDAATRDIGRAPMTNVVQLKWTYWWTP